MDTISLALALKALKTAQSASESIPGFIHEVENLTITEAETGIYKVNDTFRFYVTHLTDPSQSDFARSPNFSTNSGMTTSLLVLISKKEDTTLNTTYWDWMMLSPHNGSIRFGTTTKTIDPNTQEISYTGTSRLTEDSFKRTGVYGITDDNKTSIYEYPSVKAVVDYVDSVLTDITETQY